MNERTEAGCLGAVLGRMALGIYDVTVRQGHEESAGEQLQLGYPTLLAHGGNMFV